ncbi:MAG: NAD(P)-binding domain-containing protein [Bacteroidales bacterium]
MNTIGFIGGGRVTRIFLQAYVNQGVPVAGIAVYEPNPEVLNKLANRYPGIQASSSSMQHAAAAGTVILAVHPPVMMEVLNALKELVAPSSTVISLAPKWTVEKIRSVLTENRNIARINPSASSFINQGINPVTFALQMDPEARKQVEELMKPLGILPEVDEQKIEAYAMISAMGHTYYWFQLRKLTDLAIQFGMDPDEAQSVVAGMMKGTVDTLLNSGLAYEEVIDLVPVKPLGPAESAINAFYDEHLVPLFNKIKP